MKALIACLLVLPSVGFAKEDYISQVHRIYKTFNADSKRQYGLEVAGSGGAMMDDVQELALFYDSQQRVDTANARKLIVARVQDLLKTVNATVSLRPHLHNYPFTSGNIRMGITFLDSSGRFSVGDHIIADVSTRDGKISYGVYDATTDLLKTVHRESFDEAARIVAQELATPSPVAQ